MVELAVNVIHAFALLLPVAADNPALVGRAPRLIVALHERFVPSPGLASCLEESLTDTVQLRINQDSHPRDSFCFCDEGKGCRDNIILRYNPITRCRV